MNKYGQTFSSCLSRSFLNTLIQTHMHTTRYCIMQSLFREGHGDGTQRTHWIIYIAKATAGIINRLLLSRIRCLVKGLPLFISKDKTKVYIMLLLHTVHIARNDCKALSLSHKEEKIVKNIWLKLNAIFIWTSSQDEWCIGTSRSNCLYDVTQELRLKSAPRCLLFVFKLKSCRKWSARANLDLQWSLCFSGSCKATL